MWSMLRNKILGIVLLAAALPALCGAVRPAAAEPVSYDIAGRWLMSGEGFGEKSPVRIRLTLDGDLDLYTGIVEGRRCVTGYDLWLRINASRLDIKTWSERYSETLHVPVPLPELRPTLNEPFALPAVRTKEGLIYKVTLTSVTSGTVDIYGVIDLDVVGATEIKSEGLVWKEGTKKPETKDLLSGCRAGTGLGALFLLIPLLLRRAKGARS